MNRPACIISWIIIYVQVFPKVLLFHDTVAADILKLESLVADVEHVLLYFHYYRMYGDWGGVRMLATSIAFAWATFLWPLTFSSWWSIPPPQQCCLYGLALWFISVLRVCYCLASINPGGIYTCNAQTPLCLFSSAKEDVYRAKTQWRPNLCTSLISFFPLDSIFSSRDQSISFIDNLQYF